MVAVTIAIVIVSTRAILIPMVVVLAVVIAIVVNYCHYCYFYC